MANATAQASFAPYPIILRDGTTALMRPARPDDADRLQALFDNASRESLWLRFFTSRPAADRQVIERLAKSDGVERMALVVTRGEGAEERVIAVGSYARLPRWDSAEVAFFVDDAFQGKGIGTLLLERLAEHARQNGILTLVANVLPENQRMLEMFRRSGFAVHIEHEQGMVHIRLPATADEAAQAEAEARERIATSASLVPFFQPRAVAVIGASRQERSIGRTVLERLVGTGFEGPVYPVNPNARAVAAVRAYPTVLDVPDEVDLAVIAVPAERVLEAVEQCARKGVRALVVLSAGFAETGPAGQVRQDELVGKVRAHGMRMVGPNCMGLLNANPRVRLNATFAPHFPPYGRVAMSSQSGALGLAILDNAARLGLGLSTFVSVGNRADVSSNDLLQYWEEDPDTDLIVLYLESFGNPRKFARIARRVARHKPILAVKSGRSAAGSRAALSHTAALAGSERATEALFRQTGIIRADTLEELLDVAAVLSGQPLPAGNRVAIVTNAGGPGILCADACEAHGLSLGPLRPETLEALRRVLPPAAALANPIDMIASAGPEQYEATVRAVLTDQNVDALIAIFIPTGLVDPEAVAAAIRRGATAARETTGTEKCLLACFMVGGDFPAALTAGHGADARPVPTFRFPEPAARALARAAEYAAWRRQPPGVVVTPSGVDAAAARAVAEQAVAARGGDWLRPDEIAELLRAAGVPMPRFALAATPAEAAEAAASLGFPVAVKIDSPTITHKSDVGGVALGLASPEAVQAACAGMLARLGDRTPLRGFLVQQMVEGGIEVIAGVVDDPMFGPLVGFGLGGTAVEVLNDMAFRITPLTDADAVAMVHAIRGLPLLRGYRGQPPADIAAITDLLLRISWLVEEVPAIAEMDLNPVKVQPPGAGLSVLDARIRVRP